MMKTIAEANQDITFGLSNNLARLLREFSRDFERRIYSELLLRGYTEIRASHIAVFANLGLGAVRIIALDSLEAHRKVYAYYAGKIGQEPLQQLEDSLREAVSKLELDYLPESWTATSSAP